MAMRYIYAHDERVCLFTWRSREHRCPGDRSHNDVCIKISVINVAHFISVSVF